MPGIKLVDDVLLTLLWRSTWKIKMSSPC